MKNYLMVIALALLVGCVGNIESNRLKKATEFCKPYGGIYKLTISSIADIGDRVYCFDQRMMGRINVIDNSGSEVRCNHRTRLNLERNCLNL